MRERIVVFPPLHQAESADPPFRPGRPDLVLLSSLDVGRMPTRHDAVSVDAGYSQSQSLNKSATGNWKPGRRFSPSSRPPLPSRARRVGE